MKLPTLYQRDIFIQNNFYTPNQMLDSLLFIKRQAVFLMGWGVDNIMLSGVKWYRNVKEWGEVGNGSNA